MHQWMKRLSLYQTPAAAWASDAAALTKESCCFKRICDLFQGGKVYPRPRWRQQQKSWCSLSTGFEPKWQSLPWRFSS
jgi:hypothetical protein